ncbi:hypothetical protein QN277_007367 [Acacia crassicarpa]|uniref:F-box domain-containing protein n=1 Tax=Acacia crassicarpa TaxID=499986 RepID=A0AAE1MFB3_9FABA|nr:hypothetical protein QN277_007367 [Acacia crassicarpa]
MEVVSEFRIWDELIPDALKLVFRNLSLLEKLTVIPRVCKSWAKAVAGPYCWQEIDIEDWSNRCQPHQLDPMLRLLITRSSGSLRKLSVSMLFTVLPWKSLEELQRKVGRERVRGILVVS